MTKLTVKRKALLLLLSALALLCVSCKAQEEIQNVPVPKTDTQTVVLKQNLPEIEHTIVVTGSGEVIAKPDFATLRVGVTVTGDTAENASALCRERLGTIQDAAIALDIARGDITATGIEIEARRSEDSEEIVDFLAKDTITVVVRNVDDVSRILTTIIDAGASETFAVTYSITEASTAYRGALVAAMEDAFEKAGVLAEAGAVRVKSVIGVEELPYDESKIVGVDFESSAIAVTAKVVVTYLIG